MATAAEIADLKRQIAEMNLEKKAAAEKISKLESELRIRTPIGLSQEEIDEIDAFDRRVDDGMYDDIVKARLLEYAHPDCTYDFDEMMHRMELDCKATSSATAFNAMEK
jgi:hypothetical protein